IAANTFHHNVNSDVLLVSTLAATQTNVTVSNNVMTANGNGVLLFNLLNSTLTGNTITNSTGSQVAIGGSVNGLQVTLNIIENGSTRGIPIGDFGGGSPNANVTVTQNAIPSTAGAPVESALGCYRGTRA